MPYDLRKLPPCDEHENYWFDKDHKKAPAIWPIRGIRTLEGYYMVFLGEDKGILFNGTMFRVFETPQAALVELRKRLSNGK